MFPALFFLRYRGRRFLMAPKFVNNFLNSKGLTKSGEKYHLFYGMMVASAKGSSQFYWGCAKSLFWHTLCH